MSKVADRIFRSSSNFSLFGGKCSSTSDITVRSQIAKACAHCWRPDGDCLFRSYAVDIYAVRSFSCLFNLLLADTDTAPFNFSRTAAADPGLMLQTPSPLLLTSKCSFSQNECLRSLQTNFYRMFGEIWFCLLLATSATATNLLNSTGEASGCSFLKRVTSFNAWLQRLARRLKTWSSESEFPDLFCNPAKSKVSQE